MTNDGTIVFDRSDAAEYAGVIGGAGAVVKRGDGLLTFAGANDYSGLTTITGGTLALSGTGSIGTGGLALGTGGVLDLSALASGSYSLPGGGDLTGSGTLQGEATTLAVLGSFAPGNSPGTVTLGAGFTLDLANSGTSVFEITSPSFASGTYDLVNGDGSVIFGGVLSLVFSGGPYAEGTDLVRLFDVDGGLSGGFSSIEWSGLAANQAVAFDPATGAISVVPEPGAMLLLLTGLGVFIVNSRGRRRSRALEPSAT